jgi:hypothetical protein
MTSLSGEENRGFVTVVFLPKSVAMVEDCQKLFDLIYGHKSLVFIPL